MLVWKISAPLLRPFLPLVGRWCPSAQYWNFLFRWNFLLIKFCLFDWVFVDVLLLLHSAMTLKWIEMDWWQNWNVSNLCRQHLSTNYVTTYGRREQGRLFSNVKRYSHHQHRKLLPIYCWFLRRQSTHRRLYRSSIRPHNHREGTLLLIFLSELLCYQSPKVNLVRLYKSLICR